MDKLPNPPALLGRLWLVLLGAIITLAGLFFAIGGGKLVSLGGSYYFLLAGIGLVISGLLIIRRKPLGALLFGLIFVLSAIWAVWDAGVDFWPLISRLLAITVGAIVVALSFPLLRRAAGRAPAYGASFGLALVLAIGTGAAFYGMFIPHAPVVASGNLPARTPVDPAQEQKNWEAYGNTAGGSRFAALDQINLDNVSKLAVAWEFHTGDTPISPGANGAEDQETPLQVGDKRVPLHPAQQRHLDRRRYRQADLEGRDQRQVVRLDALPRACLFRRDTRSARPADCTGLDAGNGRNSCGRARRASAGS
jgi:quinate dehydrogenase (quinone)